MALASAASGPRHHVQFYEDVSTLAGQIAGYLANALRTGGAAVAVARPLTLAAIEVHLDKSGIDAERLRAAGKLACFDASEMLDKLLVDGMPDRERFQTHVGEPLRAMYQAAGDSDIHAYGEMVDILWIAGQGDAVLALEELWSELLAELPFRLVSGYQLRAFDSDSAGFNQVCDAHDAVEQAQSTSLTAARVLAQLEQRARALELEVARRTKLEKRMLELLQLSSQLAAADDRDRIAQLTIQNGVATLGATDGSLWLLAPGGTHLELVAIANDSIGLDRYRRLPLTGDTPVAHVTRTGEALFLGTLAEYSARFPASQLRAEHARPSHKSFVALPLALDSREPFGAVLFTFDHEREFADVDRAYKTIFARQCALALERVRASAEERRARMLADEATRAREEILSVVSHDLRNPLGTIMMCASSLLNLDLGERSPRVRSTGERIHRQAERMARLIEDLVDFAGIQAGQLAIERKPHKPDEILVATSDIFSPMAQERGLRFETRVMPELPAIECDSERAVQVMSNLVANALKVTPRGGAISIGAQPQDREVVFFVRDTGPGIAAEEIPNLFERYWRSKHQQYKGAGLGLSIARGIVDAHGGRIWVESQLGGGTTFYFSLASLRNN